MEKVPFVNFILPYTLAGFDLTTHNSASGYDITRGGKCKKF
jgi:hypothetical protein